ncbi:MAG: hypothetical protein FWF49_02730 [Oscillospiraceae bacterium]|nr:hypothetical protein [Oscillospiraceae bacterium]
MTYCMGCMQPLGDNETHCHLCGYPAARQNPSPFLPARTTLSERYPVGRVLGEPGASAEYLGLDVASKEAVVVTEFLPRGLCGREEETGALRVLPGCAESFGRLYAQFGQ